MAAGQREGDVRALEVLRQFGRDVLRLHGWSSSAPPGRRPRPWLSPKSARAELIRLDLRGRTAVVFGRHRTRPVMWAPARDGKRPAARRGPDLAPECHRDK